MVSGEWWVVGCDGSGSGCCGGGGGAWGGGCRYMSSYWLRERPDWHCGFDEALAGCLPTTNNQAELAVKHTRRAFGNVVASVGACVGFHFGAGEVRFEAGLESERCKRANP